MPNRFSQDLLDDCRRRYEDTDEPLASIAADMGILPSSVTRKARKLGWRLRKDRPPRDLSPARRAQIEVEAAITAKVAAAATGEDVLIAERLERVIETELRAIEVVRATIGAGPQPAGEAERIAHTLATLTMTLANLRRLRAVDALPAARAGQGSDDADLPDDLDAFRDALARRIEIFVRSRTAATPDDGSGRATAPSDIVRS